MKRASKAKSHAPRIGFAEWFRPGEYDRVETVLQDLRALGVQDLRTRVCWADWHTSEGDGWYAWLFPRLAKDVNILPCFLYTPPSLGVVPKFSSPPQTLKAYADFIDVMITRFGEFFDWVELWNEPNDLGDWFQNADLGGVRTAPNHFLGDYPNFKWRHFEHAIPADLSGKTVLDIGCNAGFYSLEIHTSPPQDVAEFAEFCARMTRRYA